MFREAIMEVFGGLSGVVLGYPRSLTGPLDNRIAPETHWRRAREPSLGVPRPVAAIPKPLWRHLEPVLKPHETMFKPSNGHPQSMLGYACAQRAILAKLARRVSESAIFELPTGVLEPLLGHAGVPLVPPRANLASMRYLEAVPSQPEALPGFAGPRRSHPAAAEGREPFCLRNPGANL